MTAPFLSDRDHGAIEALVTDRYLDSLLAAADRQAGDAPADADLDPDVRAAAAVLRRSLVRVHPSFRFEERLAARLAEFAGTGTRAVAAGEGTRGSLVAFRSPTAADADPLLDAILAGELDPTDDAALDRAVHGRLGRRPLLVGGAITSAALSIAGVAWVAWRASRSDRRQEARATRSTHARRAATTSAVPGGLGGPA